jgi:nucleoid-associated protein
MKVNRIIIHNLKKEQQQKAELVISAEALDSKDKKAVTLIEELNSRFKANIVYGVFAEQTGEANTFKKEFDVYLKNKKPAVSERFNIMTENTINMLFGRIDSIQAAKGGYILFVDYEPTSGQHYFSVFLIRDVTGKVFEFSKNTIVIEEVIHADTANLAMACRINLKKYKEYTVSDEGSYLGFISVKQPETSGYFLDWIGAERKKKNKEDSKNLVNIITKIEPPIDDDGKPLDRETFYRQVFDAVKAFGKNDININSLSVTIFGDDTRIMNYADENNIELSTDFFVDNNILKRLLTHIAKGDRIQIKYPPSYYGNKIKIDTRDPNTIIIKSEALANAMRKEENIK